MSVSPSFAHPSYPSAAYPRRSRRLAPLAVDVDILRPHEAAVEPEPLEPLEPLELEPLDAERIDAEREAAFQALANGGHITGLLYADAGCTPLLSAEQERTLLARAQAGDEEAREHLVKANVRLVGSVCRWYLMRTPGASERWGVGRDDLMQEGLIGLLHAIERFDLSQPVKFSTYAVHWIRQAMSRARDNHGLPIRIPSYMLSRIRQVRRLRVSLMSADGEPPSIAQLARALSLKPYEVREALEFSTLMSDPLSLDRAVLGERADDPDAQTFAELLEDAAAAAQFAAVEAALDVATAPDSCTQIIAQFKDEGLARVESPNGGSYLRHLAREMEVVERRVLHEETLEAIGDDLGISRERVRQIEVNALERIRKERRRIRKRGWNQARRDRKRAERDAEYRTETTEETGGAA